MFTPFLLTTASSTPNQPESMVYSFDDGLQRPRPYILSKVHRVSYGLLCLGGSNFEKSWGSWAFRNELVTFKGCSPCRRPR